MTETMDERELHDLEQQQLAALGTPPNAAEWEVFFRNEEAREAVGQGGVD